MSGRVTGSVAPVARAAGGALARFGAFVVFSVKRAVEGFWRNAVMSLAATVTMTLMLLLLAGLLILLSGLDAGLRFVEQKVEVEAFLADGVSGARIDSLRAELERIPEVAAVDHTTKEEARDAFREALRRQGRDDPSLALDTNPFPASLGVKLRDPGVYSEVVATLERARDDGIVDEVQLTEQVVDALLAIGGVLRTVGGAVLLMVGLTVLFIVMNSIRLAVMSRADEIEIMRLVGASDAFIRWPFILEGVLVGLLGAALALSVLGLAARPIGDLTSTLVSHVPVGFDRRLAQQLIAVVSASGLGLGALGAFISVRAYLSR